MLNFNFKSFLTLLSLLVVVLVVSSAVQPNVKCLSVGSFLFTTSSFEMGVFRFLKLFSTVMGYTFANTSISSPFFPLGKRGCGLLLVHEVTLSV